MQTKFSPAQLADPHIETANGILRACVHCGFCTATCPSYVLLGDELDSPRGRIYLIKDMLENERPASAKLVKHVDRCLSCLSCMTTCPSGVHYMHLVDHARTRIAETYVRPWPERLLRALLAVVLPRPSLFRLALVGARLARPFKGLFPGRLKGLVAMAPASVPGPSALDRPQVFPAQGVPQRRVALLTGCAQRVLRPAINEATVRLLTRLGCEVVVAEGVGCCAALVHHMGREAETDAQVKANIAAFERVMEGGALDAIVVNASGCGTMVKDYGHVLRTEVAWAERARRVAALARDVSEVLVELDLGTLVTPDKPGIDGEPPVVAYHSACSLRHGQKITKEPKRLLADAGFEVREPAEAHLCCGSAGTYNLLQPELASALGARKADRLAATGAQVIATGNIGCLAQMTGAVGIPVVHTVELLDWAMGGPRPPELG
ncbi:MAG: glycolate oxidase subunit GlcF [Rhodospirillales bacterium]|nr:glycolate oxidase subunit GlcF [Rhodospirillales bacterium]